MTSHWRQLKKTLQWIQERQGLSLRRLSLPLPHLLCVWGGGREDTLLMTADCGDVGGRNMKSAMGAWKGLQTSPVWGITAAGLILLSGSSGWGRQETELKSGSPLPLCQGLSFLFLMCVFILYFYIIRLSSNHFINLLNALILSAAEGKIILLLIGKLSCLHISHFIAVLKLVLYISWSMTTDIGSSFPFCSVRSVMGMELEKHFLNGCMMVEARPVFVKGRTH